MKETNSGRMLLLQFRGDRSVRDLERRSVLRASGLSADRLVCHDLFGTEAPVHIVEGHAGIIIGGSKCSVFESHPGLNSLSAAVRHAYAGGVPVLGICFGAQLLAHLFGGSVVRDVRHREKGTYDIELLPAASGDRLFSSMPTRFAAQCSHQDLIVTLPAGATVLARSESCPVQAFVMPNRVYGVQFHPERSKSDFEELTGRHNGDFDIMDLAARDDFLQPLRESPESERLVSMFTEMAVNETCG